MCARVHRNVTQAKLVKYEFLVKCNYSQVVHITTVDQLIIEIDAI